MNASTLPRRLGLALGLLIVLPGGLSSIGFSENVMSATPETETGNNGAKWSDIKDDTYDQRAHFAAGVHRLTARINDEISQLNAKRAGMTTDTKDWDFAMKDVMDSRDFFVSRAIEISKTTTPEAWADAKDKLGEAWHRARDALDKMHTTVTT
jgi:hypothetical protein